ncbi:GNAT family N-acetyltransferase [Cryobacterium aureum]|uniref:GNAT family N-acetyltransferase n=1 Tax=Cryobacterium aureum TaxID=995037 RepID=UPI000CF3A686
MPIPVPYTRTDAEDYVTTYCGTRWATEKSCTWAIRIADEFAGAISLDNIGFERATIGYWMAPQFRGRGILTEAANAVACLRGQCRIRSCRAPCRVCLQGNTPSRRHGRETREDDWVAISCRFERKREGANQSRVPR